MIYDFNNYIYNGLIVPMEIWRPVTEEMVPGVKPIYWISNIGNLYNSETGKYSNAKPHNDYVCIMLCHQDGTRHMTTIHRLVCMAFNGLPPEEGYEVDHVNCDRTCSYEGNLEWVTKRENSVRAHNNDLVPVAEDHYKAIFTNEEIHEICKMLQDGLPIKVITKKVEEMIYPRVYADIPSLLYQLHTGGIWKKISSQYIFSSYSRTHFTDDEIEKACQMMSIGCKYDTILIELGKTDITPHQRERMKETLYNIKRGRAFTHISSKYTFPKK